MNAKKILLVEDNQDDVDLTLRAKKKFNIMNEMVVARDGREALDYLFYAGVFEGRRKGDYPSVIFLDIKLPRMNGFEVLKKIRSEESTRLIPVVILTSSREYRDLLEGYTSGANSYVKKPVDYSEFTETLRKLWEYWLGLNEELAR